MYKPAGSWVAIPTPFNETGTIDYEGFRTLLEFHAKHGTSTLLVMGSAGEVTLLSSEERHEIVRKVSKMAKGLIPVFFGATFPTTAETVDFCKFCEAEGADGLILSVSPYLLPPQEAIVRHMLTCMKSVSIPVGVYNNPSRVGVNIEPETIEILADECPNFVADKEAMPHVSQLVEVRRRVGERIHILCCDYPKYSIVLPTLALGGHGTANIGGNIIPEEMAEISKPWDSIEQIEKCRNLYLKYYPLLQALYWLSNPIVVKAAMNLLGLPAGKPRRPYPELGGEKLEQLKFILSELGVIEKYRLD